MGEGDPQRTFAAVTAMAYDPGDYDIVEDILVEVGDQQEALMQAVWIAGDLARRLASATGKPIAEILTEMAPGYLE